MDEFVYTVPTDELHIKAEGLTYGHHDAMRDFPKKSLYTPELLIAQAQKRCDDLSAQVRRQGKTLCNDPEAFQEIFTAHYVGIYTLRTAVYDQTPKEHKEDRAMDRKLGPEKAYLARKALMLDIVTKNQAG